MKTIDKNFRIIGYHIGYQKRCPSLSPSSAPYTATVYVERRLTQINTDKMKRAMLLKIWEKRGKEEAKRIDEIWFVDDEERKIVVDRRKGKRFP